MKPIGFVELADWLISIPLIVISVVMLLAGRRMRRDARKQMTGWLALQVVSQTTAAYSDALQLLAYALTANADDYVLAHPDVLAASRRVSLAWAAMLGALDTAVAAARDTPAGRDVQRLGS